LIFVGLSWKKLQAWKFRKPLEVGTKSLHWLVTICVKVLRPLIIALISITLFTMATQPPAHWIVDVGGGGWGPLVILLIFIALCTFGVSGGIEKCLNELQEFGDRAYNFIGPGLDKFCWGWMYVNYETNGQESAQTGTVSSSPAGGNKKNKKITKILGRQSFNTKIVKKIK
tara:strand:+ start:136 stop:648 length:513 start_codon:yes stop_codon:yes gene_type:complete